MQPVAYLSLDGMLKSAPGTPDQYCNACFTADYPVPVDLGVVKEENDW